MPFKDEQLVIIAPGSQTTLAQLGIQESIAPAQLRLRSCMFPGENDNEWEPFRVRPWPKSDDALVLDESNAATDRIESEFYEDYASEDDAVWPLQQGRITNWSCFFALLSHVHRRLSPHLHSPMLLVAQPCWTARDYEKLTQFYFEKFKPPCFAIVDSALTCLWAYNAVNGCVIDVGHTKADVTAISDFNIHHSGRGIALDDCGGAIMTQTLHGLLEPHCFTREMCEQLKRSPICEILPSGAPLPRFSLTTEMPTIDSVDPSSTRPLAHATGERLNVYAAEESTDSVEADGVLDVASIVAGGNKKMEEFLAKKDREKYDKAAKKKQNDVVPTTARAVKLRNADKDLAIFHYELPVHLQKLSDNAANAQSTAFYSAQISRPTTKEIQVGPQRFQAASSGIVEKIVDAIHLAISSIEDVSKRSEVWDNIILVGNGAKIRGFREAILTAIQQKYIISPSSATIFTSELPSYRSTPTGTGNNTPQPQPSLAPLAMQQQQSSNVNPLLLAAVTSQSQAATTPMGNSLPLAHSQNHHSSHGQTPTSVRYAKMGDYFLEWKDIGFDEAQFLGAQVMAKVLFIVDGGQSKGYMTRNEYNDMGPTGIHEFGP